jgi:hypothetical protein
MSGSVIQFIRDHPRNIPSPLPRELRRARNTALKQAARARKALADLNLASAELDSVAIELDRAVYHTSPKV